MSSRAYPSRDDRGHRDRDRQRPPREAVRDEPASSRGNLNEFFLNGKGIHREVLQREICKYLGPEAYSKPSSYNGIEGYKISAVRTFTPKMVDDLQELSRSYMQENREAQNRGYQDIPYEHSRTHREAQEDTYDLRSEPRGYSTQNPYSMPGVQPGYPASTRAEYLPPQGSYAQSSIYPGTSSYGQGSTYGTPSAYSGGIRPNPNDVYSDQHEDPYSEPFPHPMYAGARPRDTRNVDPRIDIRDPRQDPRMDPRAAYAMPDARIDSRDMRDARVPQYSYSGSIPTDMPPRGGYNDEYLSVAPQVGRGGGSYAPTTRVQTGYDPRESPNMRDAYRHEPIREERRTRR